MDYKNNKFFKELDLEKHDSTTIEEINKVENAVGIRFPQQYKGFILLSNGAVGEVGNSYLSIWEIEDVLDFYEDCCKEYIPDIVIFGTDGAEMGYGFDKRNNDNFIVTVPLDSLEIEYVEFCTNTFEGFMEYLYNYSWDDK